MIWAATLGLPLSLEGVGAVLGLEKQKLTEGKSLIKYFCVPCAPTKVNGGRTRNLPEHDMEKWQQFKAYNLRDVETEIGIQEKLSRFPVPEKIWDEYHVSEEINDRGIGVDMVLVKEAIEIDSKSREHLTALMQDMTNLDNPNSVQQMKSWLADNGLEMDSLGKKEVAAAIKTAPQDITDVLSLRQQLAKSSVKKYTAMENAVCRDNRERGMFQFYGANRTGRFAGRLIQLQNLPQNHMPDLAEARGLVRSGNYDALELLYEDIPDTLSQLIRTAFVPQKDRKFIVADFSAIEARILAWLAGEQWRIKVFEEGKDIYCSSASQMFGVPVELETERKNCGTCPWLRRFSRCPKSNGSLGDGSYRGGTSASCICVEKRKSHDNQVVVGHRPCRKDLRKRKMCNGNPRFEVPLSERIFIPDPSIRQTACLCETTHGRESVWWRGCDL